MSYDLEELRTGIVELFDSAADLSWRPFAFGELPLVVSLRDLRATDATRLKMKITRVARVILTPNRQDRPRSKLVCTFCGARALSHRCPVAGWIV